MRPEALFLIGVPGSGKSTFRKHFPNHVVISSDDILEESGKSFDEYIKTATKLMWEKFFEAVKEKKDIIIDRTNMSAKSRARFIQHLKGYQKFAVDLAPVVKSSGDYPDDYCNHLHDVLMEVVPKNVEEIQQRLIKREKETGKHISDDVLFRMLENYEEPSHDEGFDFVIKG